MTPRKANLDSLVLLQAALSSGRLELFLISTPIRESPAWMEFAFGRGRLHSLTKK
jgi:hypothetical protein